MPANETPSKRVASAASSAFADTAKNPAIASAPDPLAIDASNARLLYEAAVLYAADYQEAACELLKSQVRAKDNNIRVWLMLFDFYQITNNQKEFENLSMLFTVKFERSSPAWLDLAEAGDPRRKDKRERKDFFLFKPAADDVLLSEIDRFEAFVQETGSARLDFSKLKVILPEEAELFSLVLQRVRKAGFPLWFSALDEFIALLKAGLNERTGSEANGSRGYWALLFELYILDDRTEAYEELGMEYAMAFEVSPPAWQAIARPAASHDEQDVTPLSSTTEPTDGLLLKGVFNRNSMEMREQISMYAATRQEVVIDLGHLLRIDFDVVGLFAETIRNTHLAQKRVILSNINELIAPLLEIFGVNKQAVLIRKKTD